MFKQLGDAINKQKANLNSLAASINQKDGDANEAVEEDELTMRRRMISDGLAAVIEDADKELDEPIEEEAIQALRKAASTLCYTKKYFDGSKDRMIYFPSVAKVILNFSLIEAAEKHYRSEEDQFPMVYSATLSAVAAGLVGEDDQDSENIERLAQDVVNLNDEDSSDTSDQQPQSSIPNTDDIELKPHLVREEDKDKISSSAEKNGDDEPNPDPDNFDRHDDMLDNILGASDDDLEENPQELLVETGDLMEASFSAADDKTQPTPQDDDPTKTLSAQKSNTEEPQKKNDTASMEHNATEEEAKTPAEISDDDADNDDHRDKADEDLNDSLVDFLEAALSDDGSFNMDGETEQTEKIEAPVLPPEPKPSPSPPQTMGTTGEPNPVRASDTEKRDASGSSVEPQPSSTKHAAPAKALPTKTTPPSSSVTSKKNSTPQERFLSTRFSSKASSNNPTPKVKPRPGRQSTPAASTLNKTPRTRSTGSRQTTSRNVATPASRSVASKSYASSTHSTRSRPKSALKKQPATPASTYIPRSLTTPSNVPSVAFKTTESWNAHLGKAPSPESLQRHHYRMGSSPAAQPYSEPIRPQALFSPRSVRSNTTSTTVRSRYAPPRNFGGTVPANVTSHSPTKRARGDAGRCDNLYRPYLHSDRGGCELCFSKLSESEQLSFLRRGRHLRVNLTTGGCEGCRVFRRNHDEPPPRLCKGCFANSHRETYQRLNPGKTLNRLP